MSQLKGTKVYTENERLNEIYGRYSRDPRFNDLRRDGINLVPGQGPLNPDVMLVGEAPGRKENSELNTFVGRAGKNLSMLLNGTGIAYDQVFRTNLVKYWPRDIYSPARSRKLTEEELLSSIEYLDEEIEVVKPKVIGLCGRNVIHSILPDIKDVFSVNGDLIDDKFIPLYHPGVVMYSPHKWPLVRKGFERLAAHVR